MWRSRGRTRRAYERGHLLVAGAHRGRVTAVARRASSGAYPLRVDCERAWVAFPDDRVLLSGRWRAPYHFDLVADPEFDLTKLVLGERQLAAPLALRRMSGSTAADLMGTTWATMHVISDRFAALLRSVAPTGWSTFPVELRLRGGQPMSGYRGLSITGRTGPIEEELGLDVILPPASPNGLAVAGTRGWCFEPDTWDGSDVFTPKGAAAFCVTESVADALRTAGISGLRLERMSEIEMVKF